MTGIKIFEGLIKATEQIVKKYGKQIITEERFVNILADMYPDRDNPSVFKIIKIIIKDEIAKDLLSSNIRNIEQVVVNNSSSVSKKYGFDQTLIGGIMFSLAIGSGVISRTEFAALLNNNQPAKKQGKPIQNPSPKNQKPRNKKNVDWIGVKFVLLLLWGMLGLLVSPILYVFIIINTDGLCLVGSIAVVAIQSFTLLPLYTSIQDHVLNGNLEIYPAIAGAASGLKLCAFLFWVVFPILFGFNNVLSYWNSFSGNSWPIIAFIANFLIALGIATAVTYIDEFSGINIQINKSLSLLNRMGFVSKPYRNGFLAVLVFYIIFGFIAVIIPPINHSVERQKIEELNKQIDIFNQRKDSLRNERCKETRDLSFAQFRLGDNFNTTLSKINQSDKYTIKTSYSEDGLSVNDQNYISIVDSIIQLKTDWNNEKVNIDLFFSSQQLIALVFSPKRTDGDTILSIYSAKYGEPEYRLPKFVYEKDYRTVDYNDKIYKLGSGNESIEYLSPSSYYWTYENSLLKIDHEKSYFSSSATVTYFNRIAESILKRKNEELKAREKQINDSLKKVQEMKIQQEEEERRQKELNHKKSMEQI